MRGRCRLALDAPSARTEGGRGRAAARASVPHLVGDEALVVDAALAVARPRKVARAARHQRERDLAPKQRHL